MILKIKYFLKILFKYISKKKIILKINLITFSKTFKPNSPAAALYSKGQGRKVLCPLQTFFFFCFG